MDMGLRILSSADVRTRTCEVLGVADPDLTSDEALAAALRRAAGLRCPCAPATLRQAMEESLRGLVDSVVLSERVGEAMKGLIASGDLQEHWDEDEDALTRRRLLYVTPASFAMRSGTAYLIGVAPEQPSIVPESLEVQVCRRGFLRTLSLPDEDVRSTLRSLGLVEWPHDVWLWTPPLEAPERFRDRIGQVLDAAEPVANVPDLELLDGEAPVTYYRGRWTPPKRCHSGRYVARRSQLYGARRWSFVEVSEGEPQRLVDLPADMTRIPLGFTAADQALRLQAALDRLAGHPQHLGIRTSEDARTLLDLFAPPPNWLQRRWSVLGELLPRKRGAPLFTFALPPSEAQDEIELVCERMWLERKEN